MTKDQARNTTTFEMIFYTCRFGEPAPFRSLFLPEVGPGGPDLRDGQFTLAERRRFGRGKRQA
jgi:hypothetical protein